MSSFLACKPKDAVGPSASAATAPLNAAPAPDLLEGVAATVATSVQKAELATLIEAFESTRQLPKDVDRQLLAGGRSALRRDLDSIEKKRVRNVFVDLCRRRLAE